MPIALRKIVENDSNILGRAISSQSHGNLWPMTCSSGQGTLGMVLRKQRPCIRSTQTPHVGGGRRIPSYKLTPA